MIKNFFIGFLSLFFFLVKAQDKKSIYENPEDLRKWNTGLTSEIKGRKPGWVFRGLNSFQLNQSSFMNWVPGGIATISFTGRLDYESHFTKGLNIWDSRIILGYGLQKEKEKKYIKTEDIIDIQSSYGYKFSEDWFYSTRMGFRTQFSKGMDYKKEPNLKISNIFSPAYLMLGLGADYKPNENLSVVIHPLTSRMTFISDQEVFLDENKVAKKAYGINPGKSFLFELGGSLIGRYRCEVMKNVLLDNSLTLFSDYLKGLTIVGNYAGALMFKINEFLSSQFTLDLAYDKNQIDKIQLKQTWGIGLTYLLGNDKN